MKKRLRGLLALTLVLCMGLVMTTGIASATIRGLPSDSVIVSSGAELTSDAPGSGGFEITYHNVDGTTNTVPATYTPDGQGSGTWNLAVANTAPSIDGYYDDKWEVLGTGFVEKDGFTVDTLDLKRAPIQYTINYYDGDKWLLSEGYTVENCAGNNYYVPSKEGCTFSHWTNKNGADEVWGSIDELYLTSNGTEDNNYTINLYAVWEENSAPAGGGEPEPEAPLDDSPAAGDNMPAGMLLALMTVSIAGAMMLSGKRDA